MITAISGKEVLQKVKEQDRKNMLAIEKSFNKGLIDADTRRYLECMYSDGMKWSHEVFHVLGKCFGAPKAPVMKYNYIKGCVESRPIRISAINPLSSYMVNHCLEPDPMGNQFFSVYDDKHRVRVSASSVVSIIVGAQKNIKRTLEKIIDECYTKYIEEVANAAHNIISGNGREASAVAISNKIKKKFSEKFITNASETVLGIIGGGHENIAAQLVRELDKIIKPYLRLKDVWRVKCLFEMVPQARAFIERLQNVMPERIIKISDDFCNSNNPRNYRDAKIVINIGRNSEIVPMEIICQVRKLFEFERKNHEEYEIVRKSKNKNSVSLERKMAKVMEQGIHEYNEMICKCINELFDRVGWNILYGKRRNGLLFDGFPEISKQYYPENMIANILDKLDKEVKNGVFSVNTAPIKLDKYEEIEIFHWLAKFILVAAMPYKGNDVLMSGKNQAEKLFNFVMKEMQK